MSNKEIANNLIKIMNWIYNLKIDKITYKGFKNDINLNNIKQECLKKFSEYTRSNLLSNDLVPLYDQYSKYILNAHLVSLNVKIMYFEILLGIETLKSDIDIKNKLGSYLSIFAGNPVLEDLCIILWGKTYRELQVDHAEKKELTTDALKIKLSNLKKFDGTPIDYNSVQNELIAIFDSIRVVDSNLDSNSRLKYLDDIYDMIYLTLGQNDKNKWGSITRFNFVIITFLIIVVYLKLICVDLIGRNVRYARLNLRIIDRNRNIFLKE